MRPGLAPLDWPALCATAGGAIAGVRLSCVTQIGDWLACCPENVERMTLPVLRTTNTGDRLALGYGVNTSQRQRVELHADTSRAKPLQQGRFRDHYVNALPASGPRNTCPRLLPVTARCMLCTGHTQHSGGSAASSPASKFARSRPWRGPPNTPADTGPKTGSP